MELRGKSNRVAGKSKKKFVKPVTLLFPSSSSCIIRSLRSFAIFIFSSWAASRIARSCISSAGDRTMDRSRMAAISAMLTTTAFEGSAERVVFLDGWPNRFSSTGISEV